MSAAASQAPGFATRHPYAFSFGGALLIFLATLAFTGGVGGGQILSTALTFATMYALCGFFGVLSGLTLVGLTTSADANIALRYTLLSIAGVILGGGEFTGGRVSPVGAVIGALTLTLAGSLLSFLRISPDWQIGAQGAILIAVLALRALVNQTERRAA